MNRVNPALLRSARLNVRAAAALGRALGRSWGVDLTVAEPRLGTLRGTNEVMGHLWRASSGPTRQSSRDVIERAMGAVMELRRAQTELRAAAYEVSP